MGVSTDGIIFYGYCWEDEVRLFDGEQDWDRLIARKRGHVDPWSEFPKELEDSEHLRYVRDYAKRNELVEKWKAEHRAELDAWYELLRGIEAEYGVELSYHCSDGCSMPYLHIKDEEITARRGYPVELNTDTAFRVSPEWGEKFDRWLTEMGITKPHPEPRWWLVSYWG